MKFKLKVGSKGQVVIPKIVRESLGIKPESELIMEIKDKSAEIRPVSLDSDINSWEEFAKNNGVNIKKAGWIYGDKLYEEVF